MSYNVIKNYKETRGILVKKYRSFWGQYIFVLDEKGVKSKIRVGRMIFENSKLNTKWTIGHIGTKLINIRPGFCENSGE